MRIAVIGAGYVGLVSGVCLADFGHNVTCLDNDTKKIEDLKRGKLPIYEPGLDVILKRNVDAGRITFGVDVKAAVARAEVVFIAVGTPSRRGDGYADLSYVYAAARDVASAIVGFTIIVTKSTVPVGTGDEVERIIREENPLADFAVVSNPEFLREGAAIEDFKHPNRIVVGFEDERARNIMSEVYRPLFLNQVPFVFTRRRTSELIKYAGNAFLAMKITFINEMADLCEKVGADIQDVARGIGLDRRIGDKFLHAGPGYGGSCFPKDTIALVKTASDHGSPVRLVETTVEINDDRKRAMARRIVESMGGEVRNKRIAILGLTFKPNTDDVRDSPSIEIIAALQKLGATIVGFDPEGMDNAKQVIDGLICASNAYDAAQGADAVVIVTEWDQFRALDFEHLYKILRAPILIDLRNIYRRDIVEPFGIRYTSIGRSI